MTIYHEVYNTGRVKEQSYPTFKPISYLIQSNYDYMDYKDFSVDMPYLPYPIDLVVYDQSMNEIEATSYYGESLVTGFYEFNTSGPVRIRVVCDKDLKVPLVLSVQEHDL